MIRKTITTGEALIAHNVLSMLSSARRTGLHVPNLARGSMPGAAAGGRADSGGAENPGTAVRPTPEASGCKEAEGGSRGRQKRLPRQRGQ